MVVDWTGRADEQGKLGSMMMRPVIDIPADEDHADSPGGKVTEYSIQHHSKALLSSRLGSAGGHKLFASLLCVY